MFDGGWQLELTRPALLAGLVVVPVLAYYFHRSLVDLPRRQMVLSLLVRTLIVLLLILSLAGLTLLKPTQELFVVFALDRSLSVGTESEKPINEFVNQALESVSANQFALLPFAAEPGAIQADHKLPSPIPASGEQGTDIAAAIEVATAGIPPHFVPRLILLTDGNETNGK